MASTSTTDLRKLVKITSITDLYDTLAHNGPSKLITEELTNRIVVDKKPPPNEIAMITAEHQRFAKFTKYAACICPNVDVVRKIVAFASGGDILEVGAGTGLWAKLLNAEGCKVTATDIYPPAQSEQFTKVIKLSCDDALKKYAHIGCLLMCMPSIQFPIEFAGDCCVIIGGDPKLALLPGRATVQQYYSLGYPTDTTEWELNDEIIMPTWWAEHALCRMYRRRTAIDAIAEPSACTVSINDVKQNRLDDYEHDLDDSAGSFVS